MEQKICDYVKTCPEPDFFHHPDDPALAAVHEDLKQSIEYATGTITIEIDERLLRRAEKVLGAIGWTVEEALVLFLYWCINCQEQLTAWAKKHDFGDEITISESGAMSLNDHVHNAYTETCGDTGAETDEGET